MKTLSPTERQFLTAASFENAPAHELMIEWTKQTLRDARKERLFTSVWVLLIVLSFTWDQYQQPFSIASLVVFLASLIYRHVAERRSNKQVDEDMQAFLEERS